MQNTCTTTVVYEGGGWLDDTRRPVADSDQLGAAEARADRGYTLTNQAPGSVSRLVRRRRDAVRGEAVERAGIQRRDTGVGGGYPRRTARTRWLLGSAT